MTLGIANNADREKRLVALSSIIAAVFLTTMKIIIGLLTHSLGILAEAAHSGLDLIAAAVTLFSVHVSGRPADRDHHYGHGKVENFSALVETLLLLVTCAWILYEAIDRLFFRAVHVEVTFWSFLVMGTAIVIDLTRSRALMRVAVKHGSQALEADALHFRTDVWSSSVVIVGLMGVLAGDWLSQRSPELAAWLLRADAIAALGVSAIVVYVSVQLGQRSVGALLDSAPKGIHAIIEKELLRLPGVSAVQRIRLRQSGPATFVDMILDIPRSSSLEQAHEIAAIAEATVLQMLPRSDVVVHVVPVVQNDDSLMERVRSVAARHGTSIHGLYVHDVRGHLSLEMHAEVPYDLTVKQAHERVTALEEAISLEIPEFQDVVVHIEPVGDAEMYRPAVESTAWNVHVAIMQIAQEVRGIKDSHSIHILQAGNDLSVSFHCTTSPDLLISEAHQLTIHIEGLLRERLPGLGRVIIHVEPPDDR